MCILMMRWNNGDGDIEELCFFCVLLMKIYANKWGILGVNLTIFYNVTSFASRSYFNTSWRNKKTRHLHMNSHLFLCIVSTDIFILCLGTPGCFKFDKFTISIDVEKKIKIAVFQNLEHFFIIIQFIEFRKINLI